MMQVPVKQASDELDELLDKTARGQELVIIGSSKSSLDRLTVPMPPSTLIRDHIWANAIDVLGITPEHFDRLHSLPYHHKDPFDRLIIAQAIHEDMVLVAKDQAFADYNLQTAWSSP